MSKGERNGSNDKNCFDWCCSFNDNFINEGISKQINAIDYNYSVSFIVGNGFENGR